MSMLSTTASQGNSGAESNQRTREITFGQAIREALAEEMRRDPKVFIIGEDVAEARTPFKVLAGLVDEFGPARVIDSPISEAGITGLGVGAAMTGMHPVIDIMFGDFIGLAMDQIVNQAAKVHYMSGGKLKVPLVVRTTLGATRRSAAQHSQSLHAWVSHIPGHRRVKCACNVEAIQPSRCHGEGHMPAAGYYGPPGQDRFTSFCRANGCRSWW